MSILLIDSIIIAIVCGTCLLCYKCIDPTKDIERFYHSHNKLLYHIHVFAYTVLILAFAYNAKYLISNICITWFKFFSSIYSR